MGFLLGAAHAGSGLCALDFAAFQSFLASEAYRLGRIALSFLRVLFEKCALKSLLTALDRLSPIGGHTGCISFESVSLSRSDSLSLSLFGLSTRILHQRIGPKFLSKAEGGSLLLSEETLQIRLCAVDAPETAKFGKAGQREFGAPPPKPTEI